MDWTRDNLDLIQELTWNHVKLSIVPIVLSFVLALPLGWLANRTTWARSIVITAGSLLYTIPSLPLFVILPSIIDTLVLDSTNLVVALTIYGVAIMTRAAADALASVDDTTIDAASAVGFSPAARFLRVELPLAGPVLLAGIRVVSVSTIALVSVGVLTGSRNLGLLFTDGNQRDILEEVIVGIVISLLLALIFDVVIVLIGKVLMPWDRKDSKRVNRGSSGPRGAAGSTDDARTDESDLQSTGSAAPRGGGS